jgi:predicted TIM-barrel fold metal-dependent hydrolase
MFSRRQFLLAAGPVTVAAAAAAAWNVRADSPRRRPVTPIATPDRAAAETVPVVDFHTHLQSRITAEYLIKRMDAVGVTRMVLSPLCYWDAPDGSSIADGEGSDEQALDYARRYPDRFIPFVGMQRDELNYSGFWSGDRETARLLKDTEAKLATGEFFGMGEFMLRFYPYKTSQGIVASLDRDFPPFSYAMRRFSDLSAKYRAPMVIHAEAEPRVAEGMQRLLEAHPQATFVWAHNCGRSSAQSITEMMGRFPNLHADLSGMVYSGGPSPQHYGVYWPRRTEWMHLVVDDEGRVQPDMLALFNRLSGRFMAGTDVAHARVYEFYARHLPRWRKFFAQVSEEAMHDIAYRNAERLFRPT